VIQAGALVGMQSLDNALRHLVDAKVIAGSEAYRKAFNKAPFAQFRDEAEAV
jgi:twitching motility protein PilT